LKGTYHLNRLRGGRPAAIMVRYFATDKQAAIPAPYLEFKNMMTDAKKKYPGLYPSEKQCIANQQKCVDAMWDPKAMEANVNAFNDAYQNLADHWKMDDPFNRNLRGPALLREVFKTLDFEYMQECKFQPNKAIPAEDWEILDAKMAKVAELMIPVNELLAVDTSKMVPGEAEINLHRIRLDKAKAAVKEWFKRLLLSDMGDVTMSGLPFDARMMENVHADLRTERLKTFYSDTSLTTKDKLDITDKLVADTWEKMYEVVKMHQPHRTKKEYDELIKVYHDVLDPKVGLGLLGKCHDVAKTLFLQAYWAGGEKMVKEVEKGCEKLVQIYNTWPADYTEQFKTTLTIQPDLAMKGEIGLFIKATEPYFVLKLLNRVRKEHAAMHFTRQAHQVMKDIHQHDYDMQTKYRDQELLKHPPVEESKRDLRAMIPEYADRVDDIIFVQTEIAKDKEIMRQIHEDRKDMPIPSVEELIKTMLNEALWVTENDSRQKDIDAFCGKLMKYVQSGKGNIVDLENEVKSLFPSTRVGADRPIDDLEYRRTFVTYTKAVRQRMETWAFRDAMLANCDKKLHKIHHKREVIGSHIKGEFPDPVIRMVKHLIETDKAQYLERVCADYISLVGKYQGEVYGTVTSASEMSDAEFKGVVDILQKQNPGKTYFLEKSVDPNLLAGFIVRCGPDKIDYSLATQLNSLKKAATLQA